MQIRPWIVKAYFKYVVLDSFNGANTLAGLGGGLLTLLASAFISSLMWTKNMLSTQEPTKSIELLLMGFGAVWFIILIARLCWSPFHFPLQVHGGLLKYLRKRWGVQMWPIILILVGGVLAAATISGGVVLYIHNLQRQITNLTESNKILEGHLRNVTKAGYVLAKFLPYKERFELAVEESERDWDTAQRAALVDLSIPGARDHRTEYAWKKEIDRSNFVGGRLLSAVHQAFGTAYTRLNVSMLRSAGRSKPIGKRP